MMQHRKSQAGAKRLQQQELVQSSSKRQRFWPCPVCNRSFAIVFLDDHVNHCLDSSVAEDRSNLVQSCQSLGLTLPVSSSPPSAPIPPSLIREDGVPVDSALCPVSVRGSSPTTTYRPPLSPSSSFTFPCEPRAPLFTETEAASAVGKNCGRVLPPSASPERIDGILDYSSVQQPILCKPCPPDKYESRIPLSEAVAGGGREFHSVDVEPPHPSCLTECCRSSGTKGPGIAFSTQLPQRMFYSNMDEKTRTTDVKASILDKKGDTIEEMRDGNGRPVDRPPPGFKLFQRQVQSQARLSMFCGFSTSAPLQRKPTTTVLQPGMILLRGWLNLETQQKLVLESQLVAHLFHRPTTSGGGKYHVYSMCWGSKWDSKAHRYVSKGSVEPLPDWMFELSQKLARDAQQHTPVYPSDAIFAPDIGLVNFYPVNAAELGVVGLGGHQDLDESYLMPVVSVSVGDSMTFFYRRLPPLSRRRSGISVTVDENLARDCQDGDAAHNREHQLVLESGDVLVFGGQSRLVYHGTRNVQPGTRPPAYIWNTMKQYTIPTVITFTVECRIIPWAAKQL